MMSSEVHYLVDNDFGDNLSICDSYSDEPAYDHNCAGQHKWNRNLAKPTSTLGVSDSFMHKSNEWAKEQ